MRLSRIRQTAARRWPALLFACGWLAAVTSVQAADAPSVRHFGDDVFAAGRDVVWRDTTPGDAVLAGRNVAVSGRIGDDAVLAGRRVVLDANVAGDLYAAGENVLVGGKVADSARIAGRTVSIAPQAAVEGGASLAGRSVRIDGRIGRYATVAAANTQLNGRIDGDLSVSGGELALGPQAVVEGRLLYRGRHAATIAPGAQVRGGVEQQTPTRDGEGGSRAGMIGIVLAWIAGWLVAGAVLLAAAPRVTRRVTQALRGRPLASPLVGLLLLLALPLAIVLLLATVIGIPLGLLTIPLYIVLLPLGFLASAAALGDAVVERNGQPARTSRRVLALVVALALLFALLLVPWLGWLVALLAVLFGIGAIAIAFLAGRRQMVPA